MSETSGFPTTDPHAVTAWGLPTLNKAAASQLIIEYQEPLPDFEDREFSDFVFGNQNDEVPTYQLRENEFTAFPEEAVQRLGDISEKVDRLSRDKSASYGENGTTASANSYAMLMQITRFLGAGRSGFFTLDLKSTPEPCMIQERAARLMELGQEDQGLGIILSDMCDEIGDIWSAPWQLDFLHDRWPRYTYRCSDRLSITCQHFATNGTVFVRTRFQATTALKVATPMFSNIRLEIDDCHLRELEFEDRENGFNESPNQQSDLLGPHGCSVILINNGFKPGSSATQNDDYHRAVCLISAISINGEVREFEKAEDHFGPHYRVKIKPKDDFTVSPSHPLEIVQAYRLQLMPKKSEWRDLVISNTEFLKIDEALSSSMFERVSFSPDCQVDFIMRRNLDHTLSVCSVPVPSRNQETYNMDLVIALTCGDLSGHRLVTSASFFAFQFLLSTFTYLGAGCLEGDLIDHFQPCRCNTAQRVICEVRMRISLRERIRNTCIAHLHWIRQAKIADGCFNNHYWANGEGIKPHNPDNTENFTVLTDTPFQILKLIDSANIFDEHKSMVRECLLSRVGPWIHYLDKKNKRGFFAFSRTSGMPSNGYQNYRLEDHVWIWSALQVIEDFGLGSELKREKNKGRQFKYKNARANSDQRPLERDYSPAEFRRIVLRRFTATNPVSRQRMLAVARSSSETRFLFRSRDTALFHDTKTAIFDRSDLLWKATIDAQKYHEENQEAFWDTPLRYALALLMASKGYRINSMPLKDMLKTAKNVIFQTSSASGMLTGRLNMETKEPEIFRDAYRRDFYWHVSFETLYILWQVRTILECDPLILDTVIDDSSENQSTVNISLIGQQPLEMKKLMHYNNLIDQQSIVEISDEWLYNPPNFLDFDPDISSTKDFFEYVNKGSSFEHLFTEVYQLQPRSLLRKATFSFTKQQNDLTGAIIDIPMREYTSGGRKRFQIPDQLSGVKLLSSHQMYKALNRERTARAAKKRLIWSFKADADFGLLCLLSSPEPEALAMVAFFDRHYHREKYFSDDTTKALNSWVTEFHLSSHQLLNLDEVKPLPTDLRFLGSKRLIRRASTGFRIVGDFFDRFWTCHVLEYEPRDDLDGPPSPTVADNESKYKGRFKALIEERMPPMDTDLRPWRQRKVLELILFDRMLEKIIGRYKDMITDVDHALYSLVPHVQFPESTSDSSDVLSISNIIYLMRWDSYAYFQFRATWEPFQYTLQVMEEDLKETFDVISLWKTREHAREPERPRWTRNDESKYRSVITKMTTSNNTKIRDLERYYARIRWVRESLGNRLESTRNELSFQSAENVKFFTYVTVVFLPLGFGAATMSTSGVPSAKMALDMFIAAVIILAPTLLALWWGEKIFEENIRPRFIALRWWWHRKRLFNSTPGLHVGSFLQKVRDRPKKKVRKRRGGVDDNYVDDSGLEAGELSGSED